jgi:predicted nucleic acid-binding protein
MILVDTSVWIDHLRSGNAQLADLLDGAEVLGHPFVLGELACGTMRQRREILDLLDNLPQAPRADEDEVLAFVEAHQLHGIGLGWIDVHLLASARLSGARLWTTDRRLSAAAVNLGCSLNP